jgi:F-type H+-transporting ATPase subunit a
MIHSDYASCQVLVRQNYPNMESDHCGSFLVRLHFTIKHSFTINYLGETGKVLAPYVLTLALFIFFSDLVELLGPRPPTADLSMTAALAIMTFFLIHYFGIRKKGIRGRIKDFAKPMPFIAPIKILTDLAAPVSLSCRLFGNILGGLIVMDLIYIVFPFVIPAFLSIYFNLFHAGMQTFIFITLSIRFIGEAIE